MKKVKIYKSSRDVVYPKKGDSFGWYNFGFGNGFRACQRSDVKNLKGYRVVKEHSENCRIVGTERIFYLLREPYCGNCVGNINKREVIGKDGIQLYVMTQIATIKE